MKLPVKIAAASVLVLATVAAPADARLDRKATASASKKAAIRVVLPLPSPGDATYGVAQVKIAKDPRAKFGKGARVMRSTVSGLKVSGHSKTFKKLGRNARVYVVASGVAGEAPNVRNIAFFITHKQGKGAKRVKGTIEFTVANAVADRDSYWVKKVKRDGTATVFGVKDIIASAVGNWERYLGVLGVARAIAAAHKPVDINGRFRQKVSQASSGAKLTRGGHKMSPLAKQTFELIFGTIKDPMAYQAAKRSPVAVAFIASELGNPRLAKRWADVSEKLPLQVPDTYAAAAQVEKEFTAVTPPKIARARVSMAEGENSTTAAAGEVPAGSAPKPPSESINIKVVGNGTVWGPKSIQCPSRVCGGTFASGERPDFQASAPAGHVFVRWEGCDTVHGTHCIMIARAAGPGESRSVTATFAPQAGATTSKLGVSTAGAGTGTITSAPAGIQCPTICFENFRTGTEVKLTATPAVGSDFHGWKGCDNDHGGVCTVKMAHARDVSATFVRHVYSFVDQFTGFYYPGGVAVSNGHLWVADTGHAKILRLPTGGSGTPLDFGGPGNAAGQFASPRQVAASADGSKVYVSDSYNNRVQQFDGNGNHVRTFAWSFKTPRGIAVDRVTGNVAVADTLYDRIQVFSAEGEFVREMTGLTTPEGVAYDSHGNLWVANTYADEIRAYDPAGAQIRKWTHASLHRPTGLAVDPSGTVIVANWGNNNVQSFAADGTHVAVVAPHGSAAGEVAAPVTIAVDPLQGDLYMADEPINAIQHFR